MTIVILVLIILYVISVFGCAMCFVETDIEINILSILITFFPIINTIYAFKCPSVKKTIEQLTGKEKYEK